ncbi:hypothetical protein [Aestuariivirga litoralis]|uniref:hypothetical protein n=1 Tax=Aestuariivirga litoralis TaxID=2650924 RepID=UPI0018C47BC7|nr:hypothetical protein [Aestuariivirga litoralis]MBG1231034.1 hypothetical protein [Aestuariivirga litoralis]
MKLFLAFVMMMFAATAADAACMASASRNWAHYTIEASASGPDCKNAVLSLTVRADDDYVVWTHNYPAVQLMNFSDAHISGSKAMMPKLSAWISGEGFMKTADQLVVTGEFPFTPSSDLADGMFKDAQDGKAPLFCFIQGLESATCLAILSDSGVYELGVQNFPG